MSPLMQILMSFEVKEGLFDIHDRDYRMFIPKQVVKKSEHCSFKALEQQLIILFPHSGGMLLEASNKTY
ncbi:hypothetical protein DOY81_000995 [Sarcophaga bullata]|nr:hypothetical protein DOY81_000995 [Sarcophaga bullata]